MAELYIFSQDGELLTIITESTGLTSAPFRDEINSVASEPFVFTVDADVERSKFIKEENRVVFKDKDGNFREFVIKEIDDIDNLDGPQTVATCIPAWLDELSEHYVLDKRYSNKEAQVALDDALEGTRYIGEVRANLGLASTNFYRLSSADCIFRILSVWGGELRDIVEFEGNQIISRKIIIEQRLGADKGARFEIDHNIEEIQRTILSYPKTAMYGWGASLETEGGGHTRFIDFGDVEWKKSNGDPVDKPLGQKWVGDPEALLVYGRNHKGELLHRFGEYKNQEIEDPEELLWATWSYLQENKKPVVNYRLSVNLLDKDASLGDTAVAIDRRFARPIEIQTRVIAIEYDLVDIEGTTIVEMGQHLNLEDDRVERIEEFIERNQGRWTEGAKPITNERFPDIKPAVPSNVEAIGGFKTIQLYWDYDSNVYISHYEVYGSKIKDFVPDNQFLLYRGRASSFSHEVNTDETWYYRVRAVNTHGTASDFSPQVSASTVRIISDDILFGEIIADHLADNLDIAEKLAQNTIDRINQEPMQQIEYTREQIEATERALMNQLNTRIGDVNAAIDGLQDVADSLQTRIEETESILDEYGNKFSDMELKIDDVEHKISASMTDIQRIDNTVRSHSSQIEAHAEALKAKVDSTTYETDKSGILSSIEAHSTQLQLLAEGLELAVTKEELDDIEGRIASTEATLQVHAGQIQAKAEKNEVYTRSETDNLLGKKVDTTVYNNKIAEITTSINGITQRVSNTETNLNTLTGELNSAKSQIASLDIKADSITQSVSEIRADFDNMQIGGRNLVRNGDKLERIERAYKGYDLTVDLAELKGEDVTISFDARSIEGDNQNKLTAVYWRGGVATIYFEYVTITPEWRRYSVTTKITDEVVNAKPTQIAFHTNHPQRGVPAFSGEFKNIKVERGTKATDFTPAPEDWDSRITSTEASITTLAGQIELKASQTSVDSLANRMSSVESRINVLPQEIDLAVTQKIEEIEIGGRNLLRNSGNFITTEGWTGNPKIVTKDGFRVLEFDKKSSINGIPIPVKPGTTYIFSGELMFNKEISNIKATNPLHHQLRYKGNNTGGRKSIKLLSKHPDKIPANTWIKIVVEIQTIDHADDEILFVPYVYGSEFTDTVYWVKYMKLEVGKGKATDWTPAVEEQVQTHNVLASINLSTEGVRIQGSKIHLTGETLIDSGIIGTAAIANGAITNAKIANAAIRTAHIQDGAITNAKIANLAVDDAKIANVSVSKLLAGEIDTSKIKIRGGSSTNYTLIDGAFFESRGKYTRTWKNTTKTHDVSLRFENGYLRARNHTEDHSIYFSDFGISTYADGTGDERGPSSGTIEFFSYEFGPNRGITVHSHNGIVGLKSETNDIVFDAGGLVRVIGHGFRTQVVAVPEPWTNLYLGVSGTRNGEVRVTDKEFYTGADTRYMPIRASKFIRGDGKEAYINGTGSGNLSDPTVSVLESGGVKTIGTHFYVGVARPDGEMRVTDMLGYNNGGDITYRPLRAALLYGNSLAVNTSTNLYIRPASNGEVRVTTPTSTSTYRPIRASDFIQASSEKWKTNIQKYKGQALELFRNSVVYQYNKNGQPELEYGFVVERETPNEIKREDGISAYSLQGLTVKAIQELDKKIINHDDEIEWLKLENQYLKQKIKELEGKIA